MSTYDPEENWVWIVDIDGTLTEENADPNSRGWFDYDRVDEDMPNHAVIRVVKGLLALGDHIVYVTGRPDNCRVKTRDWTTKHVIDFHSDQVIGMYMRKEGDRRTPDTEVKRDIYDTYLKDYYKIAGVIEDRARVVAMWRDLGLTVLQTQEGDY